MILWKEASMYLEVNMYYGSLWNHVVIQQGVFNRLKIIYYIPSSINNSKNSWSNWFMKYLTCNF